MAIILPHSGEQANEEFKANIDSISYTFQIRWNGRDEAWYLQVGLTGQTATIKLKTTIGNNLIAGYQHLTSVPKGGLYLIDNNGLDGRPTRDNMGLSKRFYLLYISEEEFDNV